MSKSKTCGFDCSYSTLRSNTDAESLNNYKHNSVQCNNTLHCHGAKFAGISANLPELEYIHIL